MKHIAVICNQILCGPNRAQFQRTRYLCREYTVSFLSRARICKEVAAEARRVSTCPGARLGFPKLLFPLWAAWRIWKLERTEEVALVYTSCQPQALIAGFVAQRLGMPWVADLWDSPSLGVDLGTSKRPRRRPIRDGYHRLLLRIVRRVLPKADLVVVALEPEMLVRFGVNPKASNVLAVTNGVDLQIAHPIEVSKASGRFIVVYVGHVQRLRGADVILEAAKALLEIGLDFEFALVGPIPDEERRWIEKVLERYGLQGRIEITGGVAHSEALHRIAAADICLCTLSPVIPNYRYAYPIKLFEYMALGKPIVCTRTRGTERIIQDGEDGLLVHPDDPAALAEAILKLHRDPALRGELGEKARAKAKEYDWDIINERIGERVAGLITERCMSGTCRP